MKRVGRSVLAAVISAALAAPPTGWAQASPALLQVRVVQGEGAVYAANSNATRGVIVQVTDETGRPVNAAAVSFRLPESGPSGVFRSGGRTEIVSTGADGKAEVWGMQWNNEPGSFEMRIIAVVERNGAETRGSVLCPLYLSMSVTQTTSGEPGAPEHKIGRSKKKLWIALGLAAAAGVAVVGVAGKSPSTSTTPPAGVSRPTIGAPTITLSRP